ncbi:hypothetical protein JAAARDRAFT_29841 [Jaapia argillacea MUCL 33604]|uniref:ABC transporter domain-containing protein n=1 Tax=Jaapia argillacea MUCL 33604 TaxID=933084 RepID=A0A067QMD1_9AGAM|nr:hypothetical protein JAAARDRAFT_29841 [Jaapia argillacea MUCL 33604]
MSTDSERAYELGTSRHDACTVSWNNVSVVVKDRVTKRPLTILDGVSGHVEAGGEMVALMGPSGSGKTTLLNLLANRKAAADSTVTGGLMVNGALASPETIRKVSTFVEQEDHLIGSLTVRETIDFSARLSAPPSSSVYHTRDGVARVDELIRSFGLEGQANTRIGTPIQKGISGGQKRRVSVASQLVTRPTILFLDEPTSGLDSLAAYQVMSRIQMIAKRENMIVIASIHQPSMSTFNLFSKLLLLSRGKTVYFGSVVGVDSYMASIGNPVPPRISTAEYILQLTNIDFAEDQETGRQQLAALYQSWEDSRAAVGLRNSFNKENDSVLKSAVSLPESAFVKRPLYAQTKILLHRLFLKSYRDILAYQIRIIMYLGLAIMMGTVWLRLGNGQENIIPITNALFFSGAFMSFMAVAYIPAYLEDYSTYQKESANGLYGPSAFLISNFLIGIPFLYLICILFSAVTFFLVNFRGGARSFFLFSTWLFLDLLAAESLVILVSTLLPIFVAALAVTAFSNGLWMSVNGFLVPQSILNVFWYYTFYWINYQRYVFQGMMFNEFKDRVFDCDSSCHCLYPSALESQCQIEGTAVLTSVGYDKEHIGLWVGVMIAIIAGMRLMSWGWLVFKRR